VVVALHNGQDDAVEEGIPHCHHTKHHLGVVEDGQDNEEGTVQRGCYVVQMFL